MNKLHKIFEATLSGFLTLKKTDDMDDKTFYDLLALKPGEINIVLARAAAFIKNEGGEKTRKELAEDILEVLERSSVARKFVGIGLLDEYKIFKGFPVRKGDPYDNLPNPGNQLSLTPTQVWIAWSTDATQTRKDSTNFDATKGDPIGGLVVKTSVDSTKLLLDINAITRTIKSKYQQLLHYNMTATPGKSLSKTNIDFLGTQAPIYKGDYEILTTNKVVNTVVLDKWTWNTENGQKVVQWVDSAEKQEQKEYQAPQQQQQVPQQNKNLKEIFSLIQESDDELMYVDDFKKSGGCVDIDDTTINEAALDKIKGVINWISKTARLTTRGKTLNYLSLLIRQYEESKKIYQLTKQYAEILDEDPSRVEHSEKQIEIIEDLIENAKEALEYIKSHDDMQLSFNTDKKLFKQPEKEKKAKSKKDDVEDEEPKMKDDLANYVKENKN